MLQDKPAHWVSGHFDPVLAEHVRRLREHARPGELLIVEVTDPETPLLPQRARAELVAALAMVDYVVLANGSSANAIVDAGVTTAFIEHVLRRHRGPRVRRKTCSMNAAWTAPSPRSHWLTRAIGQNDVIHHGQSSHQFGARPLRGGRRTRIGHFHDQKLTR